MDKRENARQPRPAEASRPCVQISFPSDPEYLSLVRDVVEWFAHRCMFCEKDCGRIVLSVVEATTNIIRHAYGGDSKETIHLRMRKLEGELELEFLDSGCAADAGDVVEKPPGRTEPGGLGVHLMKACMDEFRYERRPEGGSRLVLRKKVAAPEEAGPPRSRDEGEEA